MPHETKPILCYVTDRHALAPGVAGGPLDAVVERVRRAVTAGVDWVQIREKDLATGPLEQLARAGVNTAYGSSTRLLINDRLDVALAAGAGGVHLGGASPPVADVKRWCAAGGAPQDFQVGASCHSLAEAREAERGDPDYLFFGPVFATPSKADYGPPQGLGLLEQVCHSVRIPVLAIGGVTLENAAECLAAGAAGVAAIRLFQESPDLPSLVNRLRSPA